MAKMSLAHTLEVLDLMDDLAQIPHPMAEKLLVKFETFIAEEGFDESNFDPRTDSEVMLDYLAKGMGWNRVLETCSICKAEFDIGHLTQIGLGSDIYQCETCWNNYGEEIK